MKTIKRRSICFLTNTYPDFDTSYRGIFIKRMAILLQREGYHITVVTPKVYRKSHYLEKTEGITVYRFPFFSGNKLLIEYEKIPYVRMMLYYMTGSLFTLFAVVRHRCDLIHVHWAIPTGLVGVFCGVLFGKPLLVTVHGSDFRLATERSRLLTKLFLWVCKKAKHLTCVSEVIKEGMQRLDVPGEKISTFPMGVDEEFMNIGRHRKEIVNNRPFTVLSNRNLLPLYNLSLLVQSIPMVLEEEPKTRFLIAGEGAEREHLEREIKDLNVEESVHFLGRVSHESMPELLAQSDIYVSTSLSDGTSVSLLEAMAAGAFPIVTDIPSNAEWVRDGENGFLVPVGEKEVLAKKIVSALRGKALLERSRGENLDIIEEKALWAVTIERTKEIYDNILSRKVHNIVA